MKASELLQQGDRFAIKTGLAVLDERERGSIPATGQLTHVVGPPGSGKTLFWYTHTGT